MIVNRRFLSKITAFALVASIVFTTLSSNMVVAQDIEPDVNNQVSQVANSVTPIDEEEPVIVEEVVEKREQDAKQFRLSDGTYMIAQYGFPIHYLDENNVWKDYDNSVEAVAEEKSTLSMDGLEPSIQLFENDNKKYKNKKSDSDIRLTNIAKEHDIRTIWQDVWLNMILECIYLKIMALC